MPYAGICYGIFGHGDLRLVAVSVTVGKSQAPGRCAHTVAIQNIRQILDKRGDWNSYMRNYKDKNMLLSL
jgi:hypothetical protein